MEDLMWVKVETTKGNDNVWYFKGQILKAIFESIVSNRLTSGYFKLDKVYWISTEYDDDGNATGEKLYQYGKDRLKALQGDLYLRIEHLVSIAPIDGEAELERFKRLEKGSLRVVVPIRS